MTGREPLTITKKELVNRIADATKQTKVVVKDVVQRFLDEIIAELVDGNRLEFREFGVFEIRQRAARVAQNPRTLEKVEVPAKRVVKFKAGRLMRQKIGGDDGDDDFDDEDDEPVRRRAAPKAPSPNSASRGRASDSARERRDADELESRPGAAPAPPARTPPKPPPKPPSNSPF